MLGKTDRPISAQGQSRPGRGNRKSSHVRYAAEDGSRFRALAVTHRHSGLISYDGISRSRLFFGSCRGPGWVPHERERTQKIANCRRKKPRENKDVLLIQTAHNGLVAGSSPAGPTKKSITYHVFISSPVEHRTTRNASLSRSLLCFGGLKLPLHIRSGESPSSLIVDSAALSRQKAKRRFPSSFIERPINGRVVSQVFVCPADAFIGLQRLSWS